MVKKVWQLLSREWTGLHEAAYLLGFFAFLSQVLALCRDRLLAHVFGASHSLDLYYAAFRIPDFIFVSLGSIVSLSVLIPFLLEKVDRSAGEAREFLTQLFSFFFLLMTVVSAVAYWLTPTILPWLFPDYVRDALYPQLVTMSRILLLSPLFLGLSNFLASVTQVYKRFFIYALSPLLYNLGIIAGVLWFYPLWGLTGLVWGVALGAALHCLIQVPFVASRGLLPALTFRIKWQAIKRVVLLSLPRTITLSANELSELFLISFASLLSAGSISVFSFSFNLQAVPLSIIGVSYSLAAFPTLTRHYSNGDTAKFVQQMINSAQHIIFWTLPATVLFIVLRAQVVRVILGSGRFDWADTRLTAAALALFVISLVPQSLALLFVRSHYARGRTWTPLLLNALSAIVIIAGSWGLVRGFRASGLFRYFVTDLLRVSPGAGSAAGALAQAEVLMLPLGFSLGLLLNLVLHWRSFHRHYPSFSRPVLRTFWHSFSASVLAGGLAYLTLNLFSHLFDLNTFWGILGQGLAAGVVGIIAGIGLLWLMGSEELRTIWRTLHHKILGSQIVGPDPELG